MKIRKHIYFRAICQYASKATDKTSGGKILLPAWAWPHRYSIYGNALKWASPWATNNRYAFVHTGSGNAYNQPVNLLDWYDCVKWCNARSQQAAPSGATYVAPLGLKRLLGQGSTNMSRYGAGLRFPRKNNVKLRTSASEQESRVLCHKGGRPARSIVPNSNRGASTHLPGS